MSDGGTRTNVVLLGWVQEYLRSQLEQAKPDSLVVAAWDEFYRVYDGLVWRFAHSRGLRGSDLDDCAQKVWLEVASGLSKFERPDARSGLRSWLYTVVRGKAGDFFRVRMRRRADSLESAREAGWEPSSRDSRPADSVEQQWEQSLLATILEELRAEISELNWRLLRLRCVEGRDVAETAAELGLSFEQVWYRQHRLTKKLKARVAVFTGERFGDEPIDNEDDLQNA